MAETNGNGRSFWIDAAIRVVDRIGFPIVVAAFLLWRMDPTIRDLTIAIDKMTRTMSRQVSYEANNNCRLRQMMGELKWQKGSCDSMAPIREVREGE